MSFVSHKEAAGINYSDPDWSILYLLPLSCKCLSTNKYKGMGGGGGDGVKVQNIKCIPGIALLVNVFIGVAR